MIFYFTIFGILGVFSFLEIFGLKKSVNVSVFAIMTFFLFLLSFLRWETGADWEAYYTFFNGSVDWFTLGDFEWGFSRINEFVKMFFDNYNVLLFILGIIIFSFQSSAILSLSPYPVTSLFLLWSVSFGNILFVRQNIATVILFFSIRYIQKKSFLKFVCMILLAMLFHRTSLVFVFAWWIYRFNLSKKMMLVYIALSVCLSIVLGKIMEGLGGLVGGVVEQKLETYLSDGSETFGVKASMTQIVIKGFANKVFVFGICLFFFSRVKEAGEKTKGYLNLYWAGILLYFSTISISLALVRLSYAYDIIFIILIPYLFFYIRSFNLRFFLFFLFLIYLGLRLYVGLVGSYYELFVPFKTILW